MAWDMLGLGLGLALAAGPNPADFTVAVTSTVDGTAQKCLLFVPPAAAPEQTGAPVPLLVALHTWGANYDQCVSYVAQARQRGWALVAPDFRGPNRRPEACASELAVQDVLDAVAYARAHARVDSQRIYLVGGSGGGHMTLVMAWRAPALWAAASAWCPITDLAAWHAENVVSKHGYDKMLDGVCGGPPSAANQADYDARSPLFHLAAAKGLPLDINAGIHDGHTGSVPISHTLRAFNVLAAANGQPEQQLSDAAIQAMVANQTVPADLPAGAVKDPERRAVVHFRRVAGPARVTIFEGGHDQDTAAALAWLARQRQGQPAVHEAAAAAAPPPAAGGIGH